MHREKSDLRDGYDEQTGGVPFEFLNEELIQEVMSEKGERHQYQLLTKRPQELVKFERWLLAEHETPWPKNVWVGTSVTTMGTINRLKHLMKVGDHGTIRYASVEPQWGEISVKQYLGANQLHWVIAGGESSQGSQAKPYDLAWARAIRDECAEAGVPFFLKQLGTNPIENGKPLKLKDHHGGNWDEWPADLRVRQMPVDKIMRQYEKPDAA